MHSLYFFTDSTHLSSMQSTFKVRKGKYRLFLFLYISIYLFTISIYIYVSISSSSQLHTPSLECEIVHSDILPTQLSLSATKVLHSSSPSFIYSLHSSSLLLSSLSHSPISIHISGVQMSACLLHFIQSSIISSQSKLDG